MKEPPFWVQVIMYTMISLGAVWAGVHLAWWLGGLFI
jgi:hypothetical protein